MTLLTNSFEGITPSGTTVTTGNSGGASGNAFNSVFSTSATVASDSAHAAHGSLGLQLATSGTAANYFVQWSLSSLTQVWFRLYVYLTANPAVEWRWAEFDPASGGGGIIKVTTAGKVAFADSASTDQITSTASLTLNAWNRIEGFVLASTTVGQVEFKLFLGSNSDGVTPDETKTSAATLNTSAGPLTRAIFGNNGTAAANFGPAWYDDLGVSDTGYIGPVPVAGGANAAQPGQTWLRRFHHRQSPPVASLVTTAAAPFAAQPLQPPFPQRPAAHRARLGAAGALATGILAVTSLSPQPSSVPPSRPQPGIQHLAPHRAVTRWALAPPQRPFLTAKLPPTAISPRPPHRALARWVLGTTSLSPQPSSVPPPLWRQPNAPRVPHRAIWRALAAPPPAVVVAAAVAPARPQPVTNRPPPPHRALARWVLAATTLSPQPSRVPPPQWRQPNAPRPAHRAIWRVIAGPAPAVVVVTGVPPSRPQPVTNRPPAPHRAISRWVLAPTTLSPQPSRVPPPQWRQPFAPRPAHRAIWRAIAGPAPAVVVPAPVIARPKPVVNRPPAPHRAVARWVLAKTTLSAQPARVPGPQWRQPFAPRPAHRAAWKRIAGPAPPPPPFTIGALTAQTAALGQGTAQTAGNALTAATAATGSVTTGDKATGAGAPSTAPLGGITATDV